MKELDDKLYQAQSAWEDEVIRREERLTPKHFKDITITPKSLLESTTDNSESILGQIEGLPSSTEVVHVYECAECSLESSEEEERLENCSEFRVRVMRCTDCSHSSSRRQK